MPRKTDPSEATEAPTLEGLSVSLAMPSSTFSQSSDVGDVAAELILQFPERLGHLAQFRFIHLRKHSKRTDSEFAVDGSGGGFVRSDRERGIFGRYDAGLWFDAKWWDRLTVHGRRAWVYHQLCHFLTRSKGIGLLRIGHDVEAFVSEGILFGAWDEQLALFVQNVDPSRSQMAPGPIKTVTPKAASQPTTLLS